MSKKTTLFSVTKKDLEISYFRCGGKGGQKVNKTSSGCRIKHPPSGAIGESREERYQAVNCPCLKAGACESKPQVD